MRPIIPDTDFSQRHALILNAATHLLQRGAIRNLGKMVNKMHPADVAKTVRHLKDAGSQRIVVGLLDDVQARAEVIAELDDRSVVEVFGELPRGDQLEILKVLDSDDAADLLGLLPGTLSGELIAQLPHEDQSDVVELLRYPEETAGGIMTPEYLAFPTDTTVQAVISHLQDAAAEAEMVFYVFVLDDGGHLKGVLSLRNLLTVPGDTPISEVMTTPVIRARVDQDQEEVARLTARYNLLAIPVVEADETLVGIITVDDVIDVMREEATEDMLKLSGTTTEEEYTHSMGSMKAARLRLPWLMVNVAGGIVSAWVLSAFTATLESALALAAFIPISMALGGSLGLQSSIIMVRGLATGRIEMGDVRRVFLREVRVGALVGVVCGVLVGLVAMLWEAPWLGAVVGVALFVASCMAVITGTLAPVMFQRMKIDPAISSGPLVTMVNDLTGLVIYLGLAALMLHFVTV